MVDVMALYTFIDLLLFPSSGASLHNLANFLCNYFVFVYIGAKMLQTDFNCLRNSVKV